MKKALLKQICFLGICALFLNGCSFRYDELPNVRVFQRCQGPAITYEMGSLKKGDYNDLKLSHEEVQSKVEQSLASSGCFKRAGENDNAYQHYRLDIVFGTITKYDKQGGFWKSTTGDALIFEVQLVFNGKSSVQNDANQHLKIFGQESTLHPTQIQITLQNAVNSATNEATKSFLKAK